jgi:hypothetical protein
MDSRQNMEVDDWQDLPRPITHRISTPRRFLSPTIIGMLGTLLLHALVIQSLPFGRGSKAKPPETRETAEPLSKSKADSAESLVLIALPNVTNSFQLLRQNIVSSLPDLSKTKIKSSINVDPPALLNLETLALSEDQLSKSASDGGDDAEPARLSGIYTGQIQARIGRIWRRPRTPVSEVSDEKLAMVDSFQCEAQIVQDIKGNVQEILLPRCNGSPAWQHSLVLAIQQASPLPAPPSAKVFSQSISLNFVGIPYAPGSVEEEYELAPRKVARSE